jgi:predicted DNA-binding transcriptional regulator AlpA
MPEVNERRLLTKRELARQWGVGLAVIDKMMGEGLPFLKLRERSVVRFRQEDIAEFLEGRLERRTSKAQQAEQPCRT